MQRSIPLILITKSLLSFAVKDGKFIYVGDDSVTSKYSSSNIINAEGLPVYPGFIDSHAHFYNLGFF
jgi:predicted amidohydrolase YtcJ